MEDEIQEEWSDIPGYDGKYQVSNLGRVKSLKGKKERILKPQRTTTYNTVNLSINGKHQTAYVHRMVAEAFVPNPDNLKFVRFNTDNGDCRASNLKWAYSQSWEKVDYETYMTQLDEDIARIQAETKRYDERIAVNKQTRLLHQKALKEQEKHDKAEAKLQQKLDKEAAKTAAKKEKLRLAESAKQIRLELAKKRGKLK
ncbi:hypothetical protein ABID22_000115 [Pontibacter aydingkolensis]|uniref:NUMOD4 motif-containing HNH endonuclease n=1 Tax=Pontibacter aydingkolensis TaxID=1911536 RepID=A0ABS7CQT9_9BACT|nr:NUMOD4 domain-containing protein [Pontibacter aydingkolensis]MBW7466217.1 NUMOD4 motif-containing HNH endonuclease [Pontibacter aydingkolensis]